MCGDESAQGATDDERAHLFYSRVEFHEIKIGLLGIYVRLRPDSAVRFGGTAGQLHRWHLIEGSLSLDRSSLACSRDRSLNSEVNVS
jgi:hypothetical protein